MKLGAHSLAMHIARLSRDKTDIREFLKAANAIFDQYVNAETDEMCRRLIKVREYRVALKVSECWDRSAKHLVK